MTISYVSPLLQMLPSLNVSAVVLDAGAADAFASNPGAADDSDLLIYSDAAKGSNDPEVAKKIQEALNSATASRMSNAVSQDENGNTVCIFQRISQSKMV